MTQTTEFMVSFEEPTERPPPSSRVAAFGAAKRHSRRVRRLKIAIVFGSACAFAGLLLVAVYDPFGRIPAGISVGRAGLNGSKITMEHPKLSGYKRDGRPYQLLAASGVQDIKKPSVVELNEIDARVTMPDNSVVRLRAPDGVYDTVKDFMQLQRDIRVTSSSGYDARLKSADLDFKAGTIVSRDPVAVETHSSNIAANSMTISENGNTIVFIGNVRSTLSPADATPAPGGSP